MAGPRRGQAEFSILRPQGTSNRLIERVLANAAWSQAYRREVTNLIHGPCQPGRLLASAARLTEAVWDAVREESSIARSAFERVTLGRTTEAGAGADGNLRTTPGGGGRPPGGPGVRKDGTLADWIRSRARLINEELAGTGVGTQPRLNRGPGGPGK